MGYKFHGQELPQHLQESLDRYVAAGIPTGGFLERVIENDLMGAVRNADLTNMFLLPVIVGYLYNKCPAGCWGRPGIFRDWIKKHIEERERQLCATVGDKHTAHLGTSPKE